MTTLTIAQRGWYATEQEWNTPGCTPADHQVIVPGVKIDYLGHVPGGMVKARHKGQVIIIHPGCTIELGKAAHPHE